MKYKTVHCFFEQSGTFKNEFKKLGINALDYDLKNEFSQTDHIIDLFLEIDRKYNLYKSIFDNISSENDLIIAFFPCVRFENQAQILFRCDSPQLKQWSEEEKCLYDMRLMHELHSFYIIFFRLVYIAYHYKYKLIIENPYSTSHFIGRYSFLKPKWIDYDRRLRGDYYKKPTQYYFINLEPSNNFVNDPLEYNVSEKTVEYQTTVKRSLIHSSYANRFIKEFIL